MPRKDNEDKADDSINEPCIVVNAVRAGRILSESVVGTSPIAAKESHAPNTPPKKTVPMAVNVAPMIECQGAFLKRVYARKSAEEINKGRAIYPIK